MLACDNGFHWQDLPPVIGLILLIMIALAGFIMFMTWWLDR